MKQIILASNNKNKLQEIKNKLKKFDIDVISQKEAGVNIEVEETGKTFKENSYLKAKAIYDIIKKPVIADDSGLEIDCLNGEPGVYSARYAGKDATDDDKINKVLEKMKNVKDPDRTARFVCTICYIDENGKEKYFESSSEGKKDTKKHGNNGFGYDPIFIYGDKSFAEMTQEEKNKVSHRGKAIQKLVEYFKNS